MELHKSIIFHYVMHEINPLILIKVIPLQITSLCYLVSLVSLVTTISFFFLFSISMLFNSNLHSLMHHGSKFFLDFEVTIMIHQNNAIIKFVLCHDVERHCFHQLPIFLWELRYHQALLYYVSNLPVPLDLSKLKTKFGRAKVLDMISC